MITLRRAAERQQIRRPKKEGWLTFNGDRADLLGNGFGSLALLNEERLQPGAGMTDYLAYDAESVTYVREGALAYENSTGHSGVIDTGEFQRNTAGGRHTEMNASRTERAHIFKIRLRPVERVVESSHEQRRFSAAERRGLLCVIASPDSRRGSLRIHQDAVIYSAMLDPGQHVVHELAHGRRGWLHIVQGDVSFCDVVLTTGDGAGITTERAVSLTARQATELLLLDLGEAPSSSKNGEVL